MREDQFAAALQRTGGGLGGGVSGAAATPAVRTPAAPMLAGIRPIRIDIPRSGVQFTFTKVLNVREEPLTLAAWAVTTKTWSAFRSTLQVTLFLAGLFVLWRQLRGTAPNSRMVTVATALVLGSVGGMLSVTRLLGMALIIAAPLMAIALFVALARKYWTRRSGETPATGQAAGTPPPPAPNGAGIGPAVASIMVLLLANSVNANEAPLQSASDTVAIQSATYSGIVRERVAEIEAVIQLSSAKAGQTIPLFGEDVAVEQFEAAPGDVKLLRQGNSVSVRLPKKGEATLKVRFLVKLGGDVTKRQLAFGVPPALSSKLLLTVDEPEAAVEFPAAVAYHSVAAQQQTRVEAVMGAGDRVELYWAPRVKRAAEIAATVFCQNATLVSFGGGGMTTRSLLDYQITQGELREARVRIPARQRLLRGI